MVIRVALVNDDEVVVRGLDAMLRSYGQRVEVVQLAAGKPVTTPVDVALYDTFGMAQGNDAAVKLAVGRYVQFLHSLRDEELPFSIDTWVLADRWVPPVVSDQAQLGVERFWGEGWNASAEAYLRGFRGVTAFNPADDPDEPADDLLVGDGRSYGFDLLLRRSRGRLTGWTSVSLLRAERTFPDPIATAVGDGEVVRQTYPPIFDRRADLELVLDYALPWGVEAGTRWNYGSGIPYTRPIAAYAAWEYDLPRGRYELDTGFDPASRGDGVPRFVLVGDRNAERYPAYHRLDVSFRKPLERRWGTLTPYLQVLNVYNQRNVLFYFYNYDKSPATRSGLSMFPVLPTVGLEVKF